MPVSRRQFMGRSGAAMIAGTMASSSVWGANERVSMAVIGFGGRGGEHIDNWCSHPNSELVALCDVDQKILDQGVADVSKKTNAKVKGFKDMRELFDDKSIDGVSIATPNHWHTLSAIWAMEAGKDVYVEKPCSHNVWEGRQLVNAAKKYNKIIQHGTQIRSSESIREAMQKLQEGIIGEVYMARGLCYKRRASIDKKPRGAAPENLDWSMWQGPAQEREYSPNVVPYNWHWTYDFGNSDLGNQGVHQMDIARWALNVKMPSKVTGMGGKYLWDDDKETPNFITTSFHYPDAGEMGKQLVFEVRPWISNDEGGANIGVLIYGKEGYMVIPSYSKYETFLGEKKEPGPSGDKGGDHWANFLEAVTTRDASILNAPIEDGHYSSALCHLGLLSSRLGRSFDFDPATEQIIGDDEANGMLTRKYREPFVVPAIEA
ncbi:MAG: Gfo/Idh/MocA family oxidoreductase [Candidatus Hydrogenedentes bacterium]|nr:Gfo/Idh/MocA family oxidoreductase [Candidatus Hydrogenedentota bacterium]